MNSYPLTVYYVLILSVPISPEIQHLQLLEYMAKSAQVPWTYFCAIYWFVLGYTLTFPSLNFIYLNSFIFCDCFGIQWISLYLYHLINYLRYSNSLIPYLRHDCLQSKKSCLFWARPIFVPLDMHSFAIVVCHS